MRFRYWFLVTGTLVSLLFTVPLAAIESPQAAFQSGEKLTYRLRWTIINAGYATMEVLPMETRNGQQAYHFVLTAKTNAFIDTFYKVRDRIDAWSNAAMEYSLLYKKKQREGRHRRDEVVRFDWENAQADYKDTHRKLKKQIDLMPGSFDPLSAFYYVRTQKLSKGAMVKRPVTDGKKNVIGILTVVGRETITVDGKEYDTWLIIPDLKHVGGVFKKSPNAKVRLWVTADERQLPVKIASKVVVGSFVGELINAEGI
jgi:hypothetical protein